MSHRPGRIGLVLGDWPLAGLLATGCSAISKVKATYENVKGNKATMDAFTQNLNNGKSVPFAATYATSGSSPATVVYAVDPSSRRTCLPPDADRRQCVERSVHREFFGQLRMHAERFVLVLQQARRGEREDQENLFDLYTPTTGSTCSRASPSSPAFRATR